MRSLLLEDVAVSSAQPVRRTAALVASAALHAAVVTAAVVLAQRNGMASAREDAGAERPMQLLYMPAPEPVVAAATLPPPPTEPSREPERPARPAVPPADEAPEHDQPAGTDAPPVEFTDMQPSLPDEEPSAAPRPETSVAPSNAELMASEAQRIFGRRSRSNTRPGGPAAAPGLEVYLPPQPDACRPVPPREPGEPVELATVSGRVFRAGTRIPLPGAHLQMIGTPYVTFADRDGVYELRFDPALVDRCRTQYVRVTAPGFRAQTLVLYLGPAAANDIPMSRR